jgi:hypothetical protein
MITLTKNREQSRCAGAMAVSVDMTRASAVGTRVENDV